MSTEIPPIALLSENDGRYIVRVEGSGGSPHAIFVGVPLKSLPSPGAVAWDKGPDGAAALRGFAFRGGAKAVEFAYPKNDAVSLATLNRVPVLAVDPESEGRSSVLSSLTNDEIQAVTLWTLTPEPVSPNSNEAPKISASKYKIGEQMVPAETSQMAESNVKLKALPHTAGFIPLFLLIGLCALCGGLLLTRMLLKTVHG